MKDRKKFTSFLVLLLFTFFVQTAGAQGLRERDLARYENGGRLDFKWEVAAKHEEMRGKLRQFLWERWSKKELGFIVATFYSYHGDYTTHTFFVEPDAASRWGVVLQYEGECCVLDAMQKNKRRLERKKGTELYNLVERVAEESTDGRVTWRVISAQDRCEADKYRLRLRRSQTGKPSEGPFLL